MQVKHLSEAKAYEAPNHRAYCSLRLFGLDAGGPKQFTVGLSHFLPGGGAGPDASPTEKVYYVLSGELTLIADGKESVLKANDSCFIGPNESREIINRGNDVVTMLVAVSTPQKWSAAVILGIKPGQEAGVARVTEVNSSKGE